MNPLLDKLQPYPFEKLQALKAGITPPDIPHIALSIGEPRHKPPQMVLDRLVSALDSISIYPKTKGLPALRESAANWLENRYSLETKSIDPEENIIPLNGTREGLFSFIQAISSKNPEHTILMPNPFYQIYEGACLLAGSIPLFMNCTSENNYQPDFESISAEEWKKCQILIICSPGNPTGAVISEDTLIKLIKLADQHDFIIASDECYSEIYFDEQSPPPGLLQACRKMGRNNYERCVVFHSLSKRSNLPGMRSGLAAGDSDILKAFLHYRTYHGCAIPEPMQMASIIAWNDEQHVIDNRKRYSTKFRQFLDTLDGCMDVSMPDAAFYLWPRLPEDDEAFAKKLFQEQHISLLPGKYLSRESQGINPGSHHARLALVATEEECLEAARRIKTFMNTHYS